MMIDWLYLITLTVSLVISAILTGDAWMRRRTAEGRWFLYASFIITVMIISYFGFAISETETAAFFWARVRLTGLSLTPVVFLIFILVFTGYSDGRWNRLFSGLMLIPAITIACIWLLPEMMWAEWSIVPTNLVLLESPVYTGWFPVHTLYSFSLTLVVCILLLQQVLTGTRLRKRQSRTMLIGLVLPLAVVLLPTFGVTRGLPNPFPISVVVMLVAFAWALFQQDMLKAAPLAWHNIIDQMQDAIVIVGRNNTVVLFNAAAGRLFALVSGEPLPGTLLTMVSDKDVDPVQTDSETTLRLDGQLRTFDVHQVPIAYHSDLSEQAGFRMLVLRDITARKEMEENLRRYRNIVASTEDGISLVSRDYVYEIVNDAYLRRNQKARHEIEGHHAADLLGETVFETIIKPQFDRALNGETVRYADWFTYATGRRYMQVTYEPYRDEREQIMGVVANIRDTTAEKEAQERAFQLSLETERRQVLTAFIEDATHEFRTPLSMIITGTHLMARQDDAEHRRKKAEQVEAQVKHINRLVEMLLLMARLERDPETEMAPVDMTRLLTEVYQDMEHCHKDHVRHVHLQPDLPAITGDGRNLKIALHQLVENACHFTPEGGTITLSAGTEGEQLWIEVKDTGPGLTEDVLPHIFKSFWREDHAHTTPGFGLGLPIAQKIIEQHAGQIMAENTPDGSRFCIWLPLTQPVLSEA